MGWHRLLVGPRVSERVNIRDYAVLTIRAVLPCASFDRVIRRDPLAVRKATLASLLSRASPGLRFNQHLDEKDGPLVFAHACKMGLEGIVSKRRDSFYRSGRSPDWIKSKSPNAPAVKREAEKDRGR